MWIIYGCNPLSFNFHITILRCVGFSYDFLYFSCSCVVVFLFVLSFATQSGIVSIVHNVGFTTSYCTLFCTNRRASFYHFSLEAQEPHSVLSRFKAIWFNVCVHLGLFFFCCAMLSCCLQLVFVVCFFLFFGSSLNILALRSLFSVGWNRSSMLLLLVVFSYDFIHRYLFYAIFLSFST